MLHIVFLQSFLYRTTATGFALLPLAEAYEPLYLLCRMLSLMELLLFVLCLLLGAEILLCLIRMTALLLQSCRNSPRYLYLTHPQCYLTSVKVMRSVIIMPHDLKHQNQIVPTIGY